MSILNTPGDDDKYEDKDVKGASSDGTHTTVYKDDSHRSWDTDKQGEKSNDHTVDHQTGKITEHKK